MPAKSSCRARVFLEVLQERCLLSNYGLAPTVRVSHGDPFEDCTADHPELQHDTLYPGTSLETFLAADPTNPNHLAAIWQQDRWASGGARGIELGISYDGGQTWQDAPLPGVGACSGGPTLRASDPWVAFAVNGDLYATDLIFDTNNLSQIQITVSKSTDGGFTWGAPVLIPGSGGADKESIMTDPSDPNLAYVVWTGGYSRTIDGGQTWAAARSLGIGSGAQVVVLPDGTLVASDGCEIYRSTDHGQTWGNFVGFFSNCSPGQVIDPNTHQTLRAGLGLGDIAVDPNSGALYDVIEDVNVNDHQYDGIAFTMSLDGGFTWTRPVKVNQTPTNIPAIDQQAFIPTVQVAADGTVGVSYYDLRYNQGGPSLPTDYWFVPGTPDGSGGITWGSELRLTNKSFDFEQAPFSEYGKFVGDYQGRASAGLDMLNLFGHPHGRHQDGIFFRRVVNLGNTAATGNAASATQALPLVLPTQLVGTSAPVALLADQSATQALPADVPALPNAVLDSGLTGDGQALKYVAAVPALPLGDDNHVSGANDTLLNADVL